MRKIISKEKEAKKQKRNQIILGLILVGVMFFSVLGYAFRGESGTGNKIEYNGFKFYENEGLWYAEIAGSYHAFKNNPAETKDIEGKVNPVSDYYDEVLYIFSQNNEAEYEISDNLGNIAERIQYACLNEEECYGNFPLKTCESNFIIIKENDKSWIIQNESCVFIYGSQENLTKLADEFLFKVFGVKE